MPRVSRLSVKSVMRLTLSSLMRNQDGVVLLHEACFKHFCAGRD